MKWRELRAKYLFAEQDERAGNRALPLLSVSAYRGVVLRSDMTADEPRADDLSRYKVCAPGDIVINRMSAYQGAAGVAPIAGLTSPDYTVLRATQGVSPRFLGHLIRSRWFTGQISARLRGIGGIEQGNVRTPRINTEDLGNIGVRVPPFSEQIRIADFLDAETARIDALIEKKRRMITLALESFRASLDSAFPSSAEPVRLGRFVRFLTQGTSPEADSRAAEADEWAVLKLSAVKFGTYRPDENKTLPASYQPDDSLVPRRGDLLVTRSNTPEYVGDACAVIDEAPLRMLCDLIYLVRLDPRLDAGYAAYALLRSDARRQIQSAARGTSQSMVKLRGEDIKAVAIPFVSLDEQTSIVEGIHDRRSRVDRLVTRVDRQIELLHEHRHALITAAVTGQLGIAEAAA